MFYVLKKKQKNLTLTHNFCFKCFLPEIKSMIYPARQLPKMLFVIKYLSSTVSDKITRTKFYDFNVRYLDRYNFISTKK